MQTYSQADIEKMMQSAVAEITTIQRCLFEPEDSVKLNSFCPGLNILETVLPAAMLATKGSLDYFYSATPVSGMRVSLAVNAYLLDGTKTSNRKRIVATRFGSSPRKAAVQAILDSGLPQATLILRGEFDLFACWRINEEVSPEDFLHYHKCISTRLGVDPMEEMHLSAVVLPDPRTPGLKGRSNGRIISANPEAIYTFDEIDEKLEHVSRKALGHFFSARSIV